MLSQLARLIDGVKNGVDGWVSLEFVQHIWIVDVGQ